MKLRGALLLVVAATVCMLSGLISPQEAAASVDAVNQWPAKPTIISNSNTAAVSGSFTVAPGTKRLMLVAVAFESTTAPTVAVSYGGQALTQIVLNTTGANKLWVGRLNDAGIVAAGANKTLSATLTGAGTITATYVTAAVYAGVDQTTPVIGSGSLGTGTAALTIGPVGYTPSVSAINGNNGLSVYLVNWNNTNVGQTTPATGFTEVRDYIGTNFSLSANYKVKTGASAESITSTTTTSAIAALAAVTLNPAAGAGALSVATVTTCSDCHGNPPQDGPYTTRNVPPGQFIGAHSKHSGTDADQYAYVCTECHYNNGSNLKHENGFKDISGSRVPRNTYGGATNIAMTNSPTFTQTCTKSTCHSSGRTVRQYATSPTWNSTTTCLSCHGGRSSSTNLASRSANNFSMSTSHSQHLKYLYTEINCQTCHGKIASSATPTSGHTALKDYSGAIYHGNGTKNVFFTEIAYGSYTSYKTGTKKCSNTACHGGTSRNAWSESAGLNNDNTCVHCHGAATTTPSDTNKKKFAPGWGTGANKGISTDNYTSAKNFRVGAHFVHLSSVFMKQIKCNECHSVPSKPFEGTHMTGTRYNSQTLTFAQASSARILIGVGAAATPSHLSAFAGYTSGTSSKAATCSSVYCHGNRLKTGDTTGTDRKPAWNRDDLTTNTPGLVVCGRCHGNPPGGAHPVATATTGCGGCHSSVVNGTGVITNKNLHIDGRVQASASHVFPYPGASHMSAAGTTPWAACNGCHSTTATGVTYAQWVASRTGSNAPNCRSCHLNGLNTPSGTSSCLDCHGTTQTVGIPSGGPQSAFPNFSGSHTTHVVKLGYACTGCHNGYGSGSTRHGFANTSSSLTASNKFKRIAFTIGGSPTWTQGTMTCSTLSCHGNAVWGGRLKCVDCHAAAVSSPTALALDATVTTRGAVVGEFTNTWSHKRSFTGTPKVVDADCVVCHMEGVKTTNAKSAVHGNGYVNLRDPDTGANIKNVTFGGTNAGSYTEGATDVTFVRFKRDFSKRLESDANFLTIAAVQQLHCLKCHDTAGATNANAQVPTTGTALKPFGVTITGHVAPFDSNGSGNVVDVNKSFLTSNSSYHPVRGKSNNWFTHYSAAGATASNMIAPWRGPFSTRGATVNVTSWGYLISCWDCHAPAGTTYASGVVTRSVTAHGATATLRGGIRAAGTTATTNLCLNCHKVAYATTGSQHGANTAFTTGAADMGTATFNNCSYCHAFSAAGATQGTTAGSTSTLRPLRGEDAHGFNDRTAGTVGSKWTTANVRPYAFIRNSLSILVPKSTTASGETITGTAAICTGTAGTCNNNMGGDVYGGGTY